MSKAWRFIWRAGGSVEMDIASAMRSWFDKLTTNGRKVTAVSALKSLGLNLVMLAVAVGILYWVLQQRNDPELEQSVAALSSAARQTAVPRADHSESQAEMAAQDGLPAPVVSASTAVQAPSVTHPVSAKTALPARRPVTFPMNLNTARFEDFMELPGIGKKLAQRLVEYRKSHGGFRSVEDLREVRGIGEKRMERLRPLVVTAVARD